MLINADQCWHVLVWNIADLVPKLIDIILGRHNSWPHNAHLLLLNIPVFLIFFRILLIIALLFCSRRMGHRMDLLQLADTHMGVDLRCPQVRRPSLAL